MLDAVHFEELGVPAVAILTEPFASTGQAIAELAGFADYPFVTVPHPIGSLTVSEAMAVADAVTPMVLGLLTGTVDGASALDSAFAGPVTLGPTPTAAILADVVQELAAVLRADRADLTASVSGQDIALRLHIPDEACAECILPASMLVPMFQHRFDAELGLGWIITLNDPREPPDLTG